MSSDLVNFTNGPVCPIYPEVSLIGKYWNNRFKLQKGSEHAGEEDHESCFGSDLIDQVHGNMAFSAFLRTRPYLHARSVEEQIGWFVLTGVPQQTDWFRDRDVVRVLRYQLLPPMVEYGRVQIASIGCSFGMEVYSYLLALWDFRHSIELYGFDINIESLRIAASGVFPGRLPLRGTILDCLPVSFQDEALVARSAIADAVQGVKLLDRTTGLEVWFEFSSYARSQAHFAVHDILDSRLPTRFTVISLLKVLLHYPRESKLAILANVHASLVEGGWLLVDSDYADEDHFYDSGAHDTLTSQDFLNSGFVRVPAYAPGWWGGPEDLTSKVVLLRRC